MYMYILCVLLYGIHLCTIVDPFTIVESFSSKVVERILFVHAKVNRGIGYVQVYQYDYVPYIYILLCFIHYYS